MIKHVILLIFCIFMGITGISVGIGAAYPPINSIAQPFVCAGGQMSYQTNVSHPLPGQTYIRASWTCEDASGRQKHIGTLPLALYAGSLYGLLLYGILAILMMLGSRRSDAEVRG